VTRYKAEFEFAVRDGDVEGMRSFASQLQNFVNDNIPAYSGWAKVSDPKVTILDEKFEAEEL
jgi:hypothetical protein